MDNMLEEALKINEQIKTAQIGVAKLAHQLVDEEYQHNLIKSQIERGLIKQVGDEKKLGQTVDSRERVFTLAKDADPAYVAALEKCNQTRYQIELAKIEISALREKLAILKIGHVATNRKEE